MHIAELDHLLACDIEKNMESSENRVLYLDTFVKKVMKVNSKLISCLSIIHNNIEQQKNILRNLRSFARDYLEKADDAIKNNNFYFADLFYEQIYMNNTRIREQEKKLDDLQNEEKRIKSIIKILEQKINIVDVLKESIDCT